MLSPYLYFRLLRSRMVSNSYWSSRSLLHLRIDQIPWRPKFSLSFLLALLPFLSRSSSSLRPPLSFLFLLSSLRPPLSFRRRPCVGSSIWFSGSNAGVGGCWGWGQKMMAKKNLEKYLVHCDGDATGAYTSTVRQLKDWFGPALFGEECALEDQMRVKIEFYIDRWGADKHRRGPSAKDHRR